MVPSESPAESSDLEALYTQVREHLKAERWIEAIATSYRILHREPGYRDVPQLLEKARKQLAFEGERYRKAGEVWRSAVTPAVEKRQPRRRRWLPFAVLALGLVVVGVALAVAIPHFRRPGRGAEVSSESDAGAVSAPSASASAATVEMQYYVNAEGRFLLKYPRGWLVEESPAEGQPLRIVLITPEARDKPERVTIFFAPGEGQSAEQVWISVLGLIQAMQDEDTEDWLLGEAISTSVSGYHARQMPFRYTHVRSGTSWRGLIIGVVYDSMNYALVAEAPTTHWPLVWPLFEQILGSVQFQ